MHWQAKSVGPQPIAEAALVTQGTFYFSVRPRSLAYERRGFLTPQVGITSLSLQLLVGGEAMSAAARWAAKRIRMIFMVSLNVFALEFLLEIRGYF